MPAQVGKAQPHAGRFHRPKLANAVATNGYEAPVDEVRDALRVVARKKDWERLRQPTWELWLELVLLEQPVENPGPEVRRLAYFAGEPDPGRSEPRHIEAVWPPASARFHDQLIGQVLASKWSRPTATAAVGTPSPGSFSWPGKDWWRSGSSRRRTRRQPGRSPVR